MSPGLTTILVAGAVILLAVLLLGLSAARLASGGDDLRERIQVYAALPDISPRRGEARRNTRLVRLRLRLNSMLSAFASDKMAVELASANWAITVTEYMLIRLGALLGGLLLGWLISGWIVAGLAMAVVSYLIPGILLTRAIHKRRQAFEKQLVDVLVLVKGAVQSGFSLLQAMEVVEREMKAPASEEFHRVHREVGLGLSLSGALANLAARMQNRDLDMLITAINIQYQVGGNLTTMLEAVTETIRDRIHLFAEVRVITTQQRYTSYLLSLLPFFMFAILFTMSPDYMIHLFDREIICIPIGAVVGIVLGYFVLRRLGRIDV